MVGSTRYSLQGIGVLVREMAARIEIGAFVLALAVLAIISAPLRHWIIVIMMFLILLAVEALNTAIEVIVDKISPERSDFARDAKDLGSAGVFFTVIATAVYWGAAVLDTLGVIAF
jgi:diacylglycerol kinase (ATP)